MNTDSASSRRVFICVNGILTAPGDSEGWTDRAVTWLHTRTRFHAEKFEYACGPLTRRLRQQWRAEAIAKMCEFYFAADFDVNLVGHSNGCDLIARVMDLQEDRAFGSVHLFAAATDWGALEYANFRRLTLYVSANDRALQVARISRTLGGWAGLGYGDLGRRVPSAAVADPRVAVARRDDFGHSDWFKRGERFETTMQLLTLHEN